MSVVNISLAKTQNILIDDLSELLGDWQESDWYSFFDDLSKGLVRDIR